MGSCSRIFKMAGKKKKKTSSLGSSDHGTLRVMLQIDCLLHNMSLHDSASQEVLFSMHDFLQSFLS